MVILVFDNVGFKILGKMCSYDQWTLLNIIVIKEEDLKKAGFYRDNMPESERISRTPNAVWKDLVKDPAQWEAIFKEVFGLRNEDFQSLTECVFETIYIAGEFAPMPDCPIRGFYVRQELLITTLEWCKRADILAIHKLQKKVVL